MVYSCLSVRFYPGQREKAERTDTSPFQQKRLLEFAENIQTKDSASVFKYFVSSFWASFRFIPNTPFYFDTFLLVRKSSRTLTTRYRKKQFYLLVGWNVIKVKTLFRSFYKIPSRIFIMFRSYFKRKRFPLIGIAEKPKQLCVFHFASFGKVNLSSFKSLRRDTIINSCPAFRLRDYNANIPGLISAN